MLQSDSRVGALGQTVTQYTAIDTTRISTGGTVL
jgi:hypothetical protein